MGRSFNLFSLSVFSLFFSLDILIQFSCISHKYSWVHRYLDNFSAHLHNGSEAIKVQFKCRPLARFLHIFRGFKVIGQVTDNFMFMSISIPSLFHENLSR